jgi:hypothetical protein
MASKLSTSQIVSVAAVVATTPYPFTQDYFRPVTVQAVYTVTTASFTLTLQYSLDGTNWADFATGTAVSASGNKVWDIAGTKDAVLWRVNATRTSGTLDTLKLYVCQIER